MDQRANFCLKIKSVDDDQRVIEGFASTPELDRQGDSMDPNGAKFKLPMKLLWQHKADQPIGHVIDAKVTAAGIYIRAQIAKDVLPYIEHAWALIKNKLVDGLSIDWNPLAAPEFKGGAARYAKWEWLALSAVTIPANASAGIRFFKSLDIAQSAASGTAARVSSTPGVSGSSKVTPMNVSEQLTAEREALQTKSARLEELIAAEGNDGGLQSDEQAELGTLTKEVEAHTAKVARLATLEAAQASQAKTLTMPAYAPTAARRPAANVEVRQLEKGTIFTRVAMAIAAGRGSTSDSIEYAKRFSNTPEVVRFIKEGLHQKAEVGQAVLASPGWGSQLVNPSTVSAEFVELLMPRTIIGRVNGFDNVPFNTLIITQTGGSTFNWVGEAAPKPVGELAFEKDTLSFSKVAGIVVLSDELIRLSDPKAEAKVREDLIKQCAKFLDEQFIRVSVSAGASNPASITNGVSAPNATGTTAAALRHDLNIALATFDNANEDDSNLVIVMTPALARGISLLTTTLGVPEFPAMNPQGGTLLGYPVIVSSSVDSGTIVIFKPSDIFLADDGRVSLDASREATLDLSGSTSATFSLWQNNCVGLRAERWIRWQKKRDSGVVAIIDTAAYAPA